MTNAAIYRFSIYGLEEHSSPVRFRAKLGPISNKRVESGRRNGSLGPSVTLFMPLECVYHHGWSDSVAPQF